MNKGKNMAIEESYLVPTPWGWALKGAVEHRPGGVAAVVRTVRRSAIGPELGSRNAYRKLFDLQRPPEDGKDIARAAVLLLAVEGDPTAPKWGLDMTKLPTIYGTVKRLRTLLRSPGEGGPSTRHRWTVTSPVAA